MVEVAEAYSAIVSNENDTVVTFHVFLSVVCLRSANRMYKSHGIEMGLDKLRLQRRQCNFFWGGGGEKARTREAPERRGSGEGSSGEDAPSQCGA